MPKDTDIRSVLPARWKRELAGGTAAALVSFSIALPLGTLALAPLGPRYAALGVVAGLSCAIFGAVVAAFFGGTPGLRTTPMTALCLIMAGVITELAELSLDAGGGIDTARVLSLAFATVIVAGMAQAALGAARLGTAIKFVPYPVIAGFRNGLAVLIVLSQIPPLFGMSHPVTGWDWLAVQNNAASWNLLVGLVAAALVFAARAAGMVSIAPLAGIAGGTFTHYLLQHVLPAESLGAVVGPLPTLDVLPTGLLMIVGSHVTVHRAELVHIVLAGVGIAVVGSTLSLLAARVVDDTTGARHDSNRELIGQGLANIVSGCFGGVPGAGSPSTSMASHHAGSRSQLSAAVTSLLILLAATVGAGWIAALPLAAVAGVMLPVAADVADRWSVGLFLDLRETLSRRRELAGDLVIVCVVAVVTVWVNLVVAVLFGLMITAAVFAAKMSKPVVRRVYSGAVRRSMRQRNMEQTAILKAHGSCISVFELEGPLFFGTAESLTEDVESRSAASRFIVLDFRRVNALDATGTRLLQQLARRTTGRAATLIFAGIAPRSMAARMVDAMKHTNEFAHVHRFVDADRALEWTEDQLLQTHSPHAIAPTELALQDTELCQGFTPVEIALFAGMVSRETHRRGSYLFRRGEPGTSLYVIAKGAVSIILPGEAHASTRRLVTFREGVVFGELAVLRDQPRSADAFFESDAVLYCLSRENLDIINQRKPALASKLYLTISRMLAQRLTDTTSELRELER